MKCLMHLALGEAWERLPDALKAHYQVGPNVDLGHMDIQFPRWMKPYLVLLHCLGALLPRTGQQVPTHVQKEVVAGRQTWRRTLRFDDGKTATFNSYWVHAGGNRLIEYVNPVIGLEMAVRLEGDTLRYDGVRYILRFGRYVIGVPEALVLGHTTIIEQARADGAFDMDFRLTHPWFGQVFRYAGRFETQPRV